MSPKADISILGCGWLGLPLAEALVKAGKTVKGSTTSPAKLDLLAQKGIIPSLIDLQPGQVDEAVLADFLEADCLVLNIPPRLRADNGAGYLQQLQLLLKALLDAPVKKVLFASSTSVYNDLNRMVTEEDTALTKPTDPGYTLLQAENLFREREEWLTTIVRFAGLVGEDRSPGRFMAGKTGVANGDAPVNLIHREDCIAILTRIIEQEKWGQVYNACADEHPMRKDFYPAAALALGLEPPTFQVMDKTNFKLISNQKLKEDLPYLFHHPNPIQFF
ncbi:SDR family oxidoreductase [Pontibacter fetidus]|uniref:SDR family oxidoreductase n=1 Tax=Pontibacter fetidus TaxID=2700082 RepID=A0A6B2H7D3_9BACT|nr:SDR family oxidoreductase [Pontibacter fetidus]NDK56367.1 SDR family oxidoreductase [Pontibacter fetidus]